MKAPCITISSYSESWFYNHVQGQLAHNTENGYQNLIFNHIMPHFKSSALTELTEKKIQTEDRGMADEIHYNFAMPSTPNTLTQYSYAEDATYINMTGCYPLTRCYFEYNPEDGLYYRSQYLSGGTDGPHIDGANGEQLTFSNIIIQSCDWAKRDPQGYLWFGTVDSGRDA